MTIKAIYQKYEVNPRLQTHMLRVTALAKIIFDHWHGSKLNYHSLITACLLHDLGNIIKTDMVNNPPTEGGGVTHWIEVKNSMTQKYGNDDHEATLAMCREIGVSEEVLFIVNNKEFKSFDFVLDSDNWDLKVITYADHRIGFDGLLGLKQRFDDQIKRYSLSTSGNKKAAIISEKGPFLIECAFKIEKEIQEKVDLDLNKISDNEVNSEFPDLLNFEIK